LSKVKQHIVVNIPFQNLNKLTLCSFTVCLTPMGLEDGHIVADNQITSSSNQSPELSATHGRIYGGTAWAPR